MFEVVLYQPEIPPNTGNVIRLCANTGCRLHLVEPLGFRMDDRELKRAGLDYHEYATVQVHRNWGACRATVASSRLFAFQRQGGNRYDRSAFEAGDVLVFGPETRGLPEAATSKLCPAKAAAPADGAGQPQPQSVQCGGGGGVRGVAAERLHGRQQLAHTFGLGLALQQLSTASRAATWPSRTRHTARAMGMSTPVPEPAGGPRARCTRLRRRGRARPG